MGPPAALLNLVFINKMDVYLLQSVLSDDQTFIWDIAAVMYVCKVKRNVR